jgi:hypothetical protein
MSADAHPATSSSLAPPTGLGASETPSRADTLIEKNGSDKLSEENTPSTAKTPEAERGQEKNLVTEINEKKDESTLEKGSKALVTEKGSSDLAEPDEDRYITGFRLFLVFVYANLYLKCDLSANQCDSGLLLSIFLGTSTRYHMKQVLRFPSRIGSDHYWYENPF